MFFDQPKIVIHNRFAYYYFLVGKCKPQCVAIGHCSQPCDRVFQLRCPLHRGSPAHCHLCLQIGQRCLTSRMLPVSRRLWRPEVSGTSLPHHPPSDLTISTSPGSYPLPIWQHSVLKGTSKSSEVQESATRQTPDVVITDPCCQTSILQSIPLSLLQPLQYFLSNFAHFLIPKCY